LDRDLLKGDPDKPLKVENLSDIEAARRLAFLLAKTINDAA
jgi:hypothetical protein